MSDFNEFVYSIVSYVPANIVEVKPGVIPNKFHFKASNITTPTIKIIREGFHYVYLDETRGSMKVKLTADEIANAICNDYISAQLQVDSQCMPAFFALPNRVSEIELKGIYLELTEERLEWQNRWFTSMAMMADDDWKKYQRHNAVSDLQRIGARHIGWSEIQHPWMGNPAVAEFEKCPVCLTPLKLGAIVCSSCKCIIDEEKYRQFSFVSN